MKAVACAEGQVSVVDVDEPPGEGELVQIEAASICGSDLLYVGFGVESILGHELSHRTTPIFT